MKVRIVTKRCLWCGNEASVEVPEVGYAKWRGGMYVQDAFPDLSADDREILISGTHPACWDQMFPEGAEDA